jgi:hypothetical protein
MTAGQWGSWTINRTDQSNGADSEQLLVEVRRSQRGIEVLRAIPLAAGGYRVLSVPVFVSGISRDTVIDADEGPHGHLQFAAVRAVSPGATIRVWVSPSTTPRHVDDDYFKGPIGRKVGLGPATLLDPTTVAVHLRDRGSTEAAARYLDGLIRLGVLTEWEFSDPGAPSEPDEDSLRTPWEVVHPPASEPELPDETI